MRCQPKGHRSSVPEWRVGSGYERHWRTLAGGLSATSAMGMGAVEEQHRQFPAENHTSADTRTNQRTRGAIVTIPGNRTICLNARESFDSALCLGIRRLSASSFCCTVFLFLRRAVARHAVHSQRMTSGP